MVPSIQRMARKTKAKARKSKTLFCLPSGNTTTSSRRYIRAWRDLAAPFKERLGWTAFAFDPDIAFRRAEGWTTIEVPVDLAMEFYHLVRGREFVD